jgi:hypothetical protein
MEGAVGLNIVMTTSALKRISDSLINHQLTYLYNRELKPDIFLASDPPSYVYRQSTRIDPNAFQF